MKLDTATHLAIDLTATTKDGNVLHVRVRVHDIDGPGTYPVQVEQHSAGHISIRDEASGMNASFSKTSGGTVTIEELDLETMRCRGRLDVHFDQPQARFPNHSQLYLQGSFDLPVWISTEYDLKLHRLTRPAGYKLIDP
ncbi:hypothetical protein KQI65_05230 [bacterium]|nr:hypothetical protein [bacterium]